jgi:hypothetical protein
MRPTGGEYYEVRMVQLKPSHRDTSVCGNALNFDRALFRPLKAVHLPQRPGIEPRHRLP